LTEAFPGDRPAGPIRAAFPPRIAAPTGGAASRRTRLRIRFPVTLSATPLTLLAFLSIVAAAQATWPLLAPLTLLVPLTSLLAPLTLLVPLTSLLALLASLPTLLALLALLALLSSLALLALLVLLTSLLALFTLLALLALLVSSTSLLSLLSRLTLLVRSTSLLSLLTWLSLGVLLTVLAWLGRILGIGALPARVARGVAPLPFRGSCGTSVPRWVLAGCLRDFAIDLVGEIFELALRAFQGGGFVAEDALGRAFDPLPQLLDALAGVAGCLGGILGDSQFDELLGDLECVGDLLIGRLSDRVVEPFGQERLRLLRILHRALHLIHEVIESLLLLSEALTDLLALSRVTQRVLRFLVGGVELFGDLILLLVQASRLVAHLGHFLREAVRCALAELLAQIVQLAARAGAFGEGLRQPARLECLGRLTNVLPALLHLLAGLGHAVAILLVLHPFSELVRITKDLLLLIPQPLELPLDLPARRLGLGRLEGRLQLFQTFIQVPLPLGQLAEAAEHLPRFALFSFPL